MLFDGTRASGYFTGDCIESDLALHARKVLEDGEPKRLTYGKGSPFIDIRLRCGGTLHILLERVASDSAAVAALLDQVAARRPCIWHSDGIVQQVELAGEGPLMACTTEPFFIRRRFDPPLRAIVSGGDPTALAVAALAAQARFETTLVRPDGPEIPPPLANVAYRRDSTTDALAALGLDRWTAYIGASHEDHTDLPATLAALQGGAGYVGIIGALDRAGARRHALAEAGASEEQLARLHMPAGATVLGKAPWRVATGVIAEVMAQIAAPAG
jgi:xanthine dehydrogenase accessory factor